MAVNKDTRKIKEAGEYTTSPARRKANNKFAKQNYETVGYKCKKGIKSILEIIHKILCIKIHEGIAYIYLPGNPFLASQSSIIFSFH